MAHLLDRPKSVFDPSTGLLRSEHFQMAYATNDIDRACDLFRARYGIREFRRLEGPMPSGGHIHVALAWVGPLMYELLTASGPGSALYMDNLPTDTFAIRHHHLGFLIHDEAEWQALMDRIDHSGRVLLSQNYTQGFMRSCFVDAPELGHYLEYLFPEPAGLDFFQSVPAN